MTPLIFYRQQAANEQNAADAAVLGNVRQRSLRAADAWTKLAARIEHTDQLRATRDGASGSADRMSEPSENPDRGHAARTDAAIGASHTIGCGARMSDD